MVTCLNCPPGKPKSYTGKEPSPNGVGYSASFEIAGKILNGRDGKLWQVTAVGPRKVWKTIPGQVQDRDQISDPVAKDIPLEFNGGTPFVARLSKLGTAYIYQIFDSHIYVDVDERPIEQPDEPYDVVTFAGRRDNRKLVLWRPLVIQYQRYFLPEDRSSVLFLVGPRQYIFAGVQVIRFTTEDEIKEFHSCLGNNSVPYEFAVGDRYTYFISECVKMENEDLLKHRAERSANFTVDAKSNRLGLNGFRAVCDGGQPNAWDPYQELWRSLSPSKSSNLQHKVLLSRPEHV